MDCRGYLPVTKIKVYLEYLINMPDFSAISQFGVAGMAVYLMYRIASNHIDHNTKTLGELRDVIKELREFLQNHKK